MSVYVVHNENTLGYFYGADTLPLTGWTYMGILARKVIHPNGPGYDPMNGSVVVNAASPDIRLATKEDFDFFRVCSKGYFNE